MRTGMEIRTVMSEEKKKSGKKWWKRVLAVLLVVTLVAAPAVMLKTEVRFSKLKYVEDTAAFAAQFTEDTTEYLTDNRLSRAWKYLQTLIGSPKTYHDYELYSSIAIAREDYETAAKYLEECIAVADDANMDPAVIHLRVASLFVLSDQREKAKAFLNKALELDPELAAAYYLRGQLAAESGDAEGALNDLSAYVSLPAADPSIAVQIGPVFESIGEFEMAERCYSLGIKAFEENDPALYVSRARCRILQEDSKAAKKDLTAYFELTDEDAKGQAAAMQAVCMMEDGSYDEATTYFKKAIDSGYEDPALLYSQSVKSGFAAGDYKRAIEHGEKALELIEGKGTKKRPEKAAKIDATEVYFWIGLSHLALNHYKEAHENLSKVKDTKDDYPDIDYYRGVCELALENYEKAAEDFSLSIEKNENTTACYYNRAVCYIHQERNDEAKADLENVVERGDEEDLKENAEALLANMQEEN